MKKLFSILVLLITATFTGVAEDTVVLKNGDTLSGTILKQNAQHIYFKSTAFGSISLNPNDVAEIRIAPDEQSEIAVPAAAISKEEGTTGNLPKVEPAAPTAPAKKTEKKKSQWSGQAGLAIAMREMTNSNQVRILKEEKYETYRFYGNVDWKGDRNKMRWSWVYRYSEDDYRIRDDFFNVTQIYTHSYANRNLYSTAKTLLQRDYNRRIKREFLQTAEMGITWFAKESKVQLSTSAGGGYHTYERLRNDRKSGTTYSQPEFIFDESFRWDIVNTLALTQKYTHLGDLTNYNLLFSAGLENKIIRDLFIRLEYRLNRDTEVYYDDKGYFDKALLTSLLYKF
jgi:hypothetical protein